jgi:hypothetical protein
MSTEPVERNPPQQKKSWYTKLKEAAAAGDVVAEKKFKKYKKKQATYLKDMRARKVAKKKGTKAKAVQHFPLAAIPRKPAPVARPARHAPTRTAAQVPRAMRVVLRAGSDVTITIGGVEVQLMSEAK